MSECGSSANDLSRVSSRLAGYIAEASDLRISCGNLNADEGLSSLVEGLRRARAAADRVEQILADAIRIRSVVQRGLKGAQAAADDAWDNAANSAQSFAQADASPRERYARYKLASMAHLRDARRWEQIAIDVEATLEILKNAHYGIRAYREDCNTLLRALAMEDNLSRG